MMHVESKIQNLKFHLTISGRIAKFREECNIFVKDFLVFYGAIYC